MTTTDPIDEREAHEPEVTPPFGRHDAPTIGLEEELMVIDAASLDLAPRAHELLDPTGDPSAVQEMPAAQIELVTRPYGTVAEAAEALLRGRRSLVDRADPRLRFAASGTHPFASPEAVVTESE